MSKRLKKNLIITGLIIAICTVVSGCSSNSSKDGQKAESVGSKNVSSNKDNSRNDEYGSDKLGDLRGMCNIKSINGDEVTVDLQQENPKTHDVRITRNKKIKNYR
ncbi:hypothetical protein [Clostridium acetobutylicum]|uniref:hypothetical protein n=1 Tax=Clostridium acetobutylicum TaxID=1488 RepID=UPI001810BEFB|nr:hypothetical protein [Clostridium acetobutylicum]NYC95577.1 uncharacterized protein YceK [Clostridium acetobutylicum]